MQRRIHALPVQLANQIAAGEVVERPASVVKELLENSIDAGADQIELEVEQGGTRLIRVTDNGRGIHRDDLPLALAPHATSKVYSQQELEQIASLGFRGEALASIASVSRFKLASRLQGEELGWELQYGIGEPQPSPIPGGTVVEVRELFYNTPARRKFLRTERTEFLHIEEVLKRLALSRFDIAFTLLHNGRQQLRLRPAPDTTQQARRVGEVMGRGFVQQALQLSFEAAGMRLWGWLARPEASRAQADNQYFYLNGRMIRDKLISHAVRQAHQSVLEPGRYPAYLLYLEVDPRQVDVNVHPTKHEVRFRESRLVHDFIFRTLLDALTAEASSDADAALPPQHAPSPQTAASADRTLPESAARPQRIAEQQAFYRQAAGGLRRPPAPAQEAQGKALAILHQAYLLAELGGEPQLLDLAAVRRSLLRHHLEQMLADGEVRSQPLLIPQTLNLPAQQLDTLHEHAMLLSRLGFELERLGESAVVLRRIPSLLRGVDSEALLQAFLPRLPQQAGEGVPDAVLALLVEQAVAATPLDGVVEAQQLLRQLQGLPQQGREFWRPLSLSQLQQWFSGQG